MSTVYFVGAGPGDPELITVKGRKCLDGAQVVIYTGSLIPPSLVEGLNATVYDSSGMTLDEITDIIADGAGKGKQVVRLHTGDTAFYSAVSEQIEKLKERGVKCEIIPGVSSASAGAAILKQELTIPEISQTVIFTRLKGRTPVPEGERLSDLARHGATMVIFLSVGMIAKVQEELLIGYPPHTPVAVIEKATWLSQKVVRGTLEELTRIVRDASIKKTALIYVGESLKASKESMGKKSRLYDGKFRHGYRK